MKIRLQGDLIAVFLYLMGMYKEEENIPFSRACCYRARGNGFNLKGSRFRVDIRKTFCMMKVVKHWSRFIDAPSLKTFKIRLNMALDDLGYLKMPPHCREVVPDDLQGSLPTQTILGLCINMKTVFFLFIRNKITKQLRVRFISNPS